MEDRFNNIKAIITNRKENTDLNLINKNRKKMYRETLKKDDDVERDLDNNVIGKSIYIFSQIKYTKIKTYKRYIYVRQ